METKSENKTCQNCKKDFTIESEDFNFYEKIKVPPPTFCPECRQQRRYAWRNERTLYRRDCDLCGKNTVTIYSKNKPFKVYCNECWWGDGWDSSSYGQEFDFSRPFFDQFLELQYQVPRMALLNKNSVNSEYTNHAAGNKNCYLSFTLINDENVMYSTWVMRSLDCIDCSFIEEKGERLYECVDSRISYQCQFCDFLKDSSSCFYCYDCRGCNNCFMSTNLRNKSYVFRNKQYTREEYLDKMKEYDIASYSVREGLLKEFEDMLKNIAIHRSIVGERNINSSGSLIYDSKNISNSFEVERGENSKYIYSAMNVKDSMDLYHIDTAELCYETHASIRNSNSSFTTHCYDNVSIFYSDSCHNSQNLFGCICIKKGEYVILNKKYSKEEYEKLKEKIIEHMKSTGEYGEFCPPELSPFGYNETQGSLYMPMSKEEILEKNWKWEDSVPGTFGKETIKTASMPDKIEDIPDSYIQEIFACIECAKNFNVTQNELLFYRKEKIPFPRKCPNCRYKRRFDLRLPRKLWHRKCMKPGCKNEFETSYAPDRPEIVYCERCYQQEVY